MSRYMLQHVSYVSLSPIAKVLMLLLQEQWRESEPVSYGVREAAEKIGCKPNTACKAFNMLRDRGFISCAEESYFNSRTSSRARKWLLNWMPFNFKKPTNEWECWRNEN